MKIKKSLLLASSQFALAGTSVFADITTPGIDPSKVAFPELGGLINVIVTAMIIVSGLAAFLFLMLGGFQYLTSGGDKIQAQAARDRITYAILGLAIVVASVAVIQVLGAVFGIKLIGDIKWPGPSKLVGS